MKRIFTVRGYKKENPVSSTKCFQCGDVIVKGEQYYYDDGLSFCLSCYYSDDDHDEAYVPSTDKY